MIPESNIKLIVEKRQFLSDLSNLNSVIQEYHEFLSGDPESADWAEEGLNLARKHQDYLNQSHVSLKSMELAEAILREMLKNLPIEQLTFRPPRPSEPDEPSMGELAGADSDRATALAELTAQLQSVARHAPLAMQERIRFLLASISNLFQALIDQDRAQINEFTDQINLLTSSRESQRLIREIALIAREIYDALKSFTNDIPVADLTESAVGISEAVRKLKNVTFKLEEAANQNLDGIEANTERDQETRPVVDKVCGSLRDIQQKLGEIAAAHPEVAEVAGRIQDKLGDAVGAPMMMLQSRFEKTSEHYMAMMANQSFQDLTGQTLKKIIAFVENLEGQLMQLLEKYRPVLGLNAPMAPPKSLDESQHAAGRQDQDQVDSLLADLGF